MKKPAIAGFIAEPVKRGGIIVAGFNPAVFGLWLGFPDTLGAFPRLRFIGLPLREQRQAAGSH
ncbi:hypothetical protein [Photobacterium sp. TY1-4]|uniref:hypothetical protein n=1 Tax=Photobacterium sp. TY1-4 TaxID=2899122 RepID=UPI0021C2390F|nr:hypothetical protein [Photobacterium sp. TY1-4]UXI04101.1 hypothetical protein NH461_18500 [Photobacterium sp. TY1-4]